MKPLFAMSMLLLAGTTISSPATEYFRDEPVSLFDLGMLRLELSLLESQDHFSSYYEEHAQADRVTGWFSASYSQRDDMIRIAASFMDEQSSDAQMAEGCRSVLAAMRIMTSKFAWRAFAHYGDERNPELGPMIGDLYERIQLRCYVSGNDSSSGRFWATMPVTGAIGSADGFEIGKWRMDNE
jgi:hypothetical protein